MKRRQFVGGAALLAVSGGCASAQSESNDPEVWSGVLDVGQRLRLKFEIGPGDNVTLVSIDQGPNPIRGRAASVTSDWIELVFPTIDGRFTGRRTAPDRFDGDWIQRGASFPLALQRGADALGALPPLQPLTQERLKALRAQAGAPAIGAASVRRRSPSRILVDGERQIGTGVAVQEGDKWHIGSITKSMTATLIARLVDDGAIGWSETVGGLLADAIPEMHDGYHLANFRHLLSHRSGIQKDIPLSELIEFSRETPDARDERRDYARRALSAAPNGPLGTVFEYSNNGYVVAAAMLEAKLGESWESLIRAHLFEPLGLTSAGFGAPGRADALDHPVGHAPNPATGALDAYPVGGLITDNPAALGPAGRVHISLPDLLVYLAAHRDRTDYLSSHSWQVLHTPPFGGGYAMGWSVRPDGALWHNGSNTLWYAEALVDAGSETVAAAAVNTGELSQASPAVGSALFEAAAI